MDNLEEIEETSNKKGFFKNVFMIDKTEKGYLLNVIQYTLLAIIPIIVLLKSIKTYSPDVDEDKGSIAMTAEILIQLLVIMVVIFFIHRVIIYIPTYSKIPYGNVDLTNVILIFLFILFTMQTKLGEKIQILIDRFIDLIDGRTSLKQEAKKDSNVKVIQPISGNQFISNPTIEQMLTPQMTNNKSQTNEYSMQQAGAPTQSQPNFNNMYSGPQTPLVGAATPGAGMEEPMAANSFGGVGFGSAW